MLLIGGVASGVVVGCDGLVEPRPRRADRIEYRGQHDRHDDIEDHGVRNRFLFLFARANRLQKTNQRGFLVQHADRLSTTASQRPRSGRFRRY